MVLLYITNPDQKTAKKIADHLLRKKLIACANIYPINSLYPWQGKIADEKEFVLLAKTLPSIAAKAKKEIEKIHPYTIPCILQISANANPQYFQWLKKQVKK